MTPPVVDAHHHLWDPARADYPWMTDDLAAIRRRFDVVRPASRARRDRRRRDRPRPDPVLDRREPRVPGHRRGHAPDRRRRGVDGPHEPRRRRRPGRAPRGAGRRTPGRDPPPGARRAGSRLAAAPGRRPRAAPPSGGRASPTTCWCGPASCRRRSRSPRRCRTSASSSTTSRSRPIRERAMSTVVRAARAVRRRCPTSAASCRAWSPRRTGRPGSTEDLRPYVDQALEVFGPDRLLFGSDWPVSLLAAPYERVVETARTLIAGPVRRTSRPR